MDKETLDFYEANAERLARLYRSLEPEGLRQQMLAFFHPGEWTADIGCGSGRDTAWLTEQGFRAVGFDASPAMLAEAANAYPEVNFEQASLPELRVIEDGDYANVLCSATLMHIGREHLITAVLNLARILRPEGRLILSYRSSRGETEREEDGRLFTSIPTGRLVLLLEAAQLQVVEILHQRDASRPDIEWIVILSEKSASASGVRGLERVQSVLAQDQKYATYKFALIRALCNISRTQAHIVAWEGGQVYVPLWSIALLWLEYYWPILTHPTFVAQRRTEAEGGPKPVSLRRVVGELKERFTAGGLYALLNAINEKPGAYRAQLRKIGDAIRQGPVHYAGTHIGQVFRHEPLLPSGQAGRAEGQLGWVVVPESVWLDISRFNHWIEDSLVLRWAEMTREINRTDSAAPYIQLLLNRPSDDRDTTAVRSLLTGLGQPVECVWSGAAISRRFEVDHLIPYSAWGNNDWWNLLPSAPKLNNEKRDALPTRRLLMRRRESIVGYWRIYQAHRPAHFARQMGRALGVTAAERNWEAVAFAGLQEAVERVAVTRGLGRWEP